MRSGRFEQATMAVAAAALGLLVALAWNGATRATLALQGRCTDMVDAAPPTIVGMLVAVGVLLWLGRAAKAS